MVRAEALWLALIAALALAALSPPSLSSPAPGDAEGRTVARALEDLRSADEDLRVGAAILLGKYSGAAVDRALLGALGDRGARVRRAAAISLLERQGEGFDPAIVGGLLRALNDEDVEVRRAVSASVSVLMARWMSARAREALFGVATGGTFRPVAPEVPVEVAVAFLRAFRDSDALVRRNMIRQRAALDIELPLSLVLGLLSDPDPEVRLAALPLAAPIVPPDQFAARVREMLGGASSAWKLALLRELGARRHPAGEPLIESLAADADPVVALDAQIVRFEHKPVYDPDSALFRAIESGALSGDAGARVVRMFVLLDRRDAERASERLLRVADDAVRGEAIFLWLTVRGEAVSEDRWVEFLEDRSAAVRDRVVRRLRRRAGGISAGLAVRLARSERVSSREAALVLSRALDPARAREVLMELVLDEGEELRVAALEEMARRGLDGWREILERSMEDPSARVRSCAARFLGLRPGGAMAAPRPPGPGGAGGGNR